MSVSPMEWIELVKKTLRQIVDKTYQERSWFGKGPEVNSPDEIFNTLFDDQHFEDLLEAKDVPLSADQRMKGIALKDKMNEYARVTPEIMDAAEVFEDPRWDEIRVVARDFLTSLG